MPSDPPRVHGLGGIFFKAEDPEALGAWYAEHLGVGVQAWGGAVFPWRRADTGQDAFTVWSPFKATTEYFKPSDKPFMLNFRVDDLEATLAALREEGCNVLDRREDGEQGRFGYVMDPEGHLVELWEPAPDPASAGEAGA
ncbi:VOC family protein [Marilutibacter aestuarii]|uniref:VOC family protein n=1 Tax=Marilutibacter aestuarii TaxID=1706195 RepID=A0A508ACF1_9GAMM|nr:VOC family protein [Lysobacter aestuarii]TQD47077.1 VOC family protein [Lysobacter aestuarii]